MSRRIAVSFLVLFSLLAAASSVRAQYFGGNKVQYEDFNFQILKTEHFDIYFYEEEERAARLAGKMAERWYARLSRILDYELRGKQPLILYAAHPHFQQTNVISGLPGEGTGGVTESLKRRIVMPFAGPLAETDHVLGHELVHAFQFDLTAQNRSASSAALRFPLWFMEGMAEYLSVGPVDVMTAAWIRDAALNDNLPTLEELSDPNFFPYRFGHAFWAYVGGQFGDQMVGEILKTAAAAGDVIAGIENVLQTDAATLSENWHQSIRETYRPLVTEARTASDFARALITDEQHGGSLNVAPSLSPDGERLVFLSERDLFSIEMFLADAETGEVQAKIVETATDPHFESLQFIRSSGSFNPDGTRFIFAGLSAGQPLLSVVDVTSAEIVQERRFPELGEIFNPSWSPDGTRIVFSAQTGGLLDLYLFDMETDILHRLTEGEFAELHPTWSPDGTAVVFVTDRFSSTVGALAMGHYELATIDIGSGEIARIPLFAEADHWNPQWVGDEVFFLADPDGRPNLYRTAVAGGAVRAVTDLSTGVHGITKLSPAISVARDGSRVVFTVREDDEYRIYAMDGEAAGGTAYSPPRRARTWAALPPIPRSSSRVASWFDVPLAGLPEESYPVEDYKANLNLDYVGQPSVIVGTDRFDSFIGGGIGFLWSDMLGNHNLGVQGQIMGNFEDASGLVGYTNLASRWSWGGSVSHVPYRSRRFSSGIAEIDGELAQLEQLLELRQTESQAVGFVAYPFNRARRIEFASGFTHYAFSRQAEAVAVSLETGRVILDETVDLEAPSSLNLGTSSAALVHDTAVLGPISPLLGTRYRFEGGANYGSLNFSNVLADFRQYFMPKTPFTIATRVLHFGRYGGDAEDSRLTDLFLGYPNLVRGYQAGSFSADECNADGGCPVFERLFGSRLAVANVEFRFPLIGLFTGDPWRGPIPIELAFFGDAGVAWTSDVSPEIFGGDRSAVTSAGMALRIGIQRFLTVELDFVRPFDRSEKGFLFEFNLKSGF